jgi:hypothetical protein
MQLEEKENKDAIVRLNHQELVMLNNALNEVCNGLDLDEFSIRMGAEIEEVEALLKEVGSIINTIDATEKND